MAFTYLKAVNQAANMLGAIAGSTAATLTTNYAVPYSDAVAVGPDFIATFLQDACESVISEIVQAICETRFHPERTDYSGQTGSLGTGSAIPAFDQFGDPLVGVMGRVSDSADGRTCLPVSLDRVRSVNRFASTIYSGADMYLFAIDDGAGTIEHTRSNVVIEWPVLITPAYFSGNDVPLRNWHERAVVAGIIAHVAPKEDMFSGLLNVESAFYQAHLLQIRALGDQETQPPVMKAPSLQ